MAVRTIKRIVKDTVVNHIYGNTKIKYFSKLSYSKVRALLLTSAGVAMFS